MLYLHTLAKSYHQDKDLPGLLCSSKQPSWSAPWPVNLKLIACRLFCCLLLPHKVIREAKWLLSAVTTCFFFTMKEPSCVRLPTASLLQLLLDTVGRLQPTQGFLFCIPCKLTQYELSLDGRYEAGLYPIHSNRIGTVLHPLSLLRTYGEKYFPNYVFRHSKWNLVTWDIQQLAKK